MNINLTLLGQMISFLIFIGFCMKYVWPYIINAMEERQARISAGLRDAERAKQELKQAQQKAHEIVAEAKEQAGKRIEQANKRAEQVIDEAKLKAREEGERLKAQAQTEIDQQIQEAKQELKSKVATLVVMGAEKILEKQVDKSVHDRMLTGIASDL